MKLAPLAALILLPSLAIADGIEPWRARTLRDATRSAMVEETKPNWDEVFLRPPWDVRSNLAGAPTVEVRRNYVYVEDTDGTLTVPFQSNRDLQGALTFGLQQVYSVLPDEFVFVYMFTSFDTNVGAFFYAPLVNTDSGIGQQLFRQGRGASEVLQGYIFMNYWKSFNDQFPGFPQNVIDSFAQSVFNQEAGHRWGTSFEVGPGVADGHLQQLLGRDDAHWSYFTQTNGSPMEGNSWRDNGNGSFTTTTDVRAFNYSDVDLYLMGLIRPDQVQPWFLISNPNVTGKRDIYQQQLGASSPPQLFQPMTLSGTRVDYTINDLTSRLGLRIPNVNNSPKRFRVVFAMLASRTNKLSEAQRNEFEGDVDRYATGFHTGTRNLGELDYILIDQPTKIAIGQTCPAASECVNEAPLCTRPELGQENICTRGCADVQGCPIGFCCAMGSEGASICTPDSMCPRPPPPDAGVADTGEPVMMSTPDSGIAPACTCDTTTVCDPTCACDAECPCTCDLTTGCDSSCTCDAECIGDGALPLQPSSGCGVSGGSAGNFALLGLLGAIALLTRRRLQ